MSAFVVLCRLKRGKSDGAVTSAGGDGETGDDEQVSGMCTSG